MLKVVYIIIFLSIAFAYSYIQMTFFKLRTKENNVLFLMGLLVKIIGALFIFKLFARPFVDSYEYFYNGQILRSAFEHDLLLGLKLCFSSPDTWDWDTRVFGDQFLQHLSNDTDSFMFVKICFINGILTNNSYLLSTLSFGIISHHLLWRIFQLTKDKVQMKSIFWFGFIYLWPSTVMWSSGLLKDTIAFWALAGLFICYLSTCKNLFRFGLALLCVMLLFSLKAYLFLLLFFLALIVFGAYYGSKILPFSKQINVTIIASSLLLIILSFLILSANQQHFWGHYQIDGILGYIHGIENWNTRPGQNTSFHYGDAPWTISKLIWTAPLALITGLFRPFPWELTSSLILVFSLESLSFLGLLILAVRNYTLDQFKAFIKDPKVLFVLLTIIAFAYLLGMTTFNFGALSRYKTPLFLMVIVLIYFIKRKKK